MKKGQPLPPGQNYYHLTSLPTQELKDLIGCSDKEEMSWSAVCMALCDKINALERELSNRKKEN